MFVLDELDNIFTNYIAEHAALRELRETVPAICPYSIAHGNYANSTGYFLLMEWFEAVGREEMTAEGGSGCRNRGHVITCQ